jgi:hypothetical protein
MSLSSVWGGEGRGRKEGEGEGSILSITHSLILKIVGRLANAILVEGFDGCGCECV